MSGIGLYGAERVDEAYLLRGRARDVEQARTGDDDGEILRPVDRDVEAIIPLAGQIGQGGAM